MNCMPETGGTYMHMEMRDDLTDEQAAEVKRGVMDGSIPLDRMNDLVTELRAVTAEKAEVEAKHSALREELKKILENTGLKKFTGDAGTISLAEKSSWRMPQDPARKAEFLDYLKRRDLLEGMTTIHSQTLNSWANAEEAAALERGDLGFEIPGLGTPETYNELRFNKK